MSDYIERERIEKSFDGIYDCADLIFEPHDQCCAADDCAHCKWFETKNAIKKRILSIPAADVRPVVMCCDCKHFQVNMSPSGYLPQGVPEWECRYWLRPTDPTDFCSYGEKWEES